MANHAERRRVHDQRMIGKQRDLHLPVGDAQSGQIARQPLGADVGAIGNRHGGAGIQQGSGNCTSRTTGAQQQCWPGGRIDTMGAEVGEEAIAIGIAAGNLALAKHQRVDGASAARGVVNSVADIECGKLVRNGDIGAGKSGYDQTAHGGSELTGPDRQRNIGAVNPVPLQPEPMQARRPGICDRPAGDAGDSGLTRQNRHGRTFPWSAAKINAGFIQSPCSREQALLAVAVVSCANCNGSRDESVRMPRDETSKSARPSSGGASVRLIEVSRRWGTTTALDHISIEIAPGSFTVLLGPSGCGKTTCLRIVAGLETATSGRVEIGGRDVTNLPPAARGVAMVFQSYALFPHLNVAENIVFGLKARRVPAAERARRLARAIEILGIAHLLERKPGQLSGGQQQRVALGRAIVAETPVCLMDEPLSNLDAQLRADMRREILALQRRLGITMLYVTHDQTEAMGMADQIVLLRNGRIEQDAPPAEIYEHPATSFAASFIGTPPMNLFALERRNSGMVLRGTDGPILAPPADGELTGGIRPESLRITEHGIAARVRHAEYLGADTVVACMVGEVPMLARLPGRAALKDGASVCLATDQPIHVFDTASGRRVEGVVAAREPVRV
jgi:sn-glycerol 3-phosphate transport system ATP-binding protein